VTVVIIGASAGLGRALSAQLAKEGHDLILVARDARDLKALCAHLSLMHGVSVRMVSVDAGDDQALATALQAEFEQTRNIDALFAPIGVSNPDDDMTLDITATRSLLGMNFLSVVTAIQTTLPYLKNSQTARIVGFGSIATIRGRGRNIAYSAAKRALTSYFESLRHALSDDPVTVQFYQLGYIQTQQFYGQTTLLPAMTANHAAAKILRDGNRDFGQRFLPRFWWPIALIMRILPWSIFRRLKF
jgi:short-subunit dehydrogenase